MEITLKTVTEYPLTEIRVSAHVRYWEDSIVNGESDTENGDRIPLRKGELWNLTIEPETGRLIGWPQGTTAEIHYKVCDRCSWSFVSGGEVVKLVEDEYVPNWLCPKEPGYGDYIIMDIDENGMIQDWEFSYDETEED